MKLITIALLSLALSLTGGAVMPEPTTASVPAAETEVPFRLVSPPYPLAVDRALEEVRRDGGHRLVPTGTAAFVVIALGERPTGGYGLEIVSAVRRPDGSVLIAVRERMPDPGSITTQALTYPTAVLSLPSDVTAVAVEYVQTP